MFLRFTLFLCELKQVSSMGAEDGRLTKADEPRVNKAPPIRLGVKRGTVGPI